MHGAFKLHTETNSATQYENGLQTLRCVLSLRRHASDALRKKARAPASMALNVDGTILFNRLSTDFRWSVSPSITESRIVSIVTSCTRRIRGFSCFSGLTSIEHDIVRTSDNGILCLALRLHLDVSASLRLLRTLRGFDDARANRVRDASSQAHPLLPTA